jgi:hypothetical protein
VKQQQQVKLSEGKGRIREKLHLPVSGETVKRDLYAKTLTHDECEIVIGLSHCHFYNLG